MSIMRSINYETLDSKKHIWYVKVIFLTNHIHSNLYEDEYGIEYDWTDNDVPIGSIDIGEDLFPEVTFENSPKKIKLEIIEE